MNVKQRLTIKEFFRKYGKKILVGLAIWGVVLLINYFVGKYDREYPKIDTNYEPHNSVMESEETVPDKLKTPIEELIGKFVDYCNEKDYESAYNLLSTDCKNNIYPDIEDFKKYVDSVFPNKKIYNIQNFSNKDNVYIYTVKILNDILASGLSNEEDSNVYSEKYAIITENNELKLSIREYVGRQNLSYMYEDDDMKIKIESVDKKYDHIVYNINIKNKSENYIVFANNVTDYEIALDTSDGLLRRGDEVLTDVELFPEETNDFSFKFTVFYDDNTEINGILFDYIRVYKDVDSYDNGEDPIDDFSIKIKF